MNGKIGVVFTPEKIARYMSKILIYNYLILHVKNKNLIKNLVYEKKEIKENKIKKQIKKLLTEIKILEPSLGEGILLVEIVDLIFSILELLEKNTKDKYKEKILKSIYGFEVNETFLKKAVFNLNEKFSVNTEYNFVNDDFIVSACKLKNKFDLIIGNPPYVNEKENKNIFTKYKTSKYYQGRMNIWYFFMQHSIDLLKDNGVLTFIIPNNWTGNKSAEKLRKALERKTKILSITDFNDDTVFENALIQTMIITLKKDSDKGKNSNYVFLYKKKKNKDPVDKFLDDNYEYYIADFKEKVVFTNENVFDLLRKIEQKRDFELKKLKEITQGIIHPQSSVSENNLLKDNNLKLNEGVFVLSKEEVKRLDLTDKERKILKPTYTTKELKKYFKIASNRYWTIYTDRTFNDSEKIKYYPNIKKHLDRYKRIFTSDYKPYGLHRKRKEFFFKKGAKILIARKSVIPVFTYMEEECYPTFTFNVIKSERIDLKYLTMLFNSKLVMFWLKHKGKLQGNHFQLDITPVLSIPIAYIQVNNNYIKELSKKLDILIKEKKEIVSIIKEADEIIYRIYGLTSKEIDIIEKDITEEYGKYIIA